MLARLNWERFVCLKLTWKEYIEEEIKRRRKKDIK